MRPIPSLALFLSLAVCTAVAWGATPSSQWKWRDASGHLYVSDLPPPSSVPDSAILERPTDIRRYGRAVPPSAKADGNSTGTPTAAASAPRSPAASTDPELEARRKRAADEQAALQREQEAKVAAQRADNCTRARSALQALNDGQRVARTNEKGEREVLDDKGRAEEMQRARSVIASDCK
jgi:hypothetical protein